MAATPSLSWLEGKPAWPAGVTWGVPWKQGELDRNTPLKLCGNDGASVPVQSWPTAYWPDGSVKWTAHAASFHSEPVDNYSLEPGAAAPADASLSVKEADEYIEVDTGAVVCRFNRSGPSVIRELSRDGRKLCAEGRLVAMREERHYTSGRNTIVEETLQSIVESTKVEQKGPIRAVVKIQGRHQSTAGGRRWLPFTLRFVFYARQASIRIVHTLLYDGNPHQDFLKGLGIRFTIPMKGPLYNRHLRMAGDTGWFSESPKGLMTFRLPDRQRELYEQQTAGSFLSLDSDQDAGLRSLLDDSPEWGDFKLTQISSDSYMIQKRTKEGCGWIHSVSGSRAGGLLYTGGEEGGLAIGVRRFWEKFPTGLEAAGLTGEEAAITAWFWSPDAPAMDLRHYDTETHVISCYEGADELRSTPYGVGNTSELMLWCCESTPNHDTLDAMVREKESPPLLVCEPARYHETRALGFWSLPDRSTPVKSQLEDTLDQLIGFYQEEIEQRRWYGFWDYGDVMHSYDPVRHTWKYDIGGCAWQNTELAPNIWLWYMFLRSGRADIFRLAEAMTRHTSEVDVYHIGEYAGLGSRHNVLHWGCGCKEARIGMAGLHKFYYYLTADERIMDIMDEAKDSDYATLRLDPMRAYFAKDEFPTHTRSGPDWAAFCSNWLAHWERYEDTSYRDKMLRGIECLKGMPNRLLTGPVFGYEPKTGELLFMGHENYGHHLMICMGGAQVWTEMAYLLQDPEWDAMLAEYGEFYNLPKEEKIRRTSGALQGKDWNIPMLSTAMMAFSASRMNNGELAKQAWDYLLRSPYNWSVEIPLETREVPRQEFVRSIREIPWISTNTVSQWSINTIVCLEMIGEHLPVTIMPQEEVNSP
ncbi:hypothetical protein NQZ67_17285 [Paenibacillus sp. SCIV0701]|uniref:Tat pathway signal sequence domain protein n=2 Tax=Paenibacillus soyae TaxID=2969249 RepID=A0A9X2SA25_9BACL|nr:hypothetical protein [Paenibacillus soyae]MCR2805640.1 hypothetical protein [Paenibacillus soyae]